MTVAHLTAEILGRLGVEKSAITDGNLEVFSPVNGERIAAVTGSDALVVKDAINAAKSAFASGRTVPAPRRGELVRLLGEELRAAKADLGRLVSIEVGKILSEG